jgi:hypothetical protein
MTHGLVGKLNSAASNFDRGRWKRFDLFKAALDIFTVRDVLRCHDLCEIGRAGAYFDHLSPN